MNKKKSRNKATFYLLKKKTDGKKLI